MPEDPTEKYDILVRPLENVPAPEPEADPRRLEEALLFEKFRRRYRTDFFEFCRASSGFQGEENLLLRHVHGEFCDRLQSLYWGLRGRSTSKGLRSGIYLLPRGNLKSTIASQLFPQWVLLQNDVPTSAGANAWQPPRSFNGKKGYDQRILLASNIDDFSEGNLDTIKVSLSSNPFIHKYFGNCAPAKRTEGKWKGTQANIMWRQNFSEREANLNITSLDSAITSGHYDIAIADDIVDERVLDSEAMLAKIQGWYATLLPVITPGLLIVIGTRWHDKDLYGELLQESGWDVYIERAERRPEEIEQGKRRFFFEEKYDEPVLAALREKMGPYRFSCNYNNDPIDPDTADFKPSYFKEAYYDLPAGNALQQFLAGKTIVTTIDPALSKKKRACYRVVTTWAWNETGHAYCLDFYYNKEAKPDEWLREGFRQVTQWGSTFCGLEQLELYAFTIEVLSQELGQWINWQELSSNDRAKDERIRALIPFAKARKLHLQRHQTMLEDEATRWPTGTYRDALDATAYQLDLAFLGATPPSEALSPEQALRVAQEESWKQRLANRRIGDYGPADSEYDWYHM